MNLRVCWSEIENYLLTIAAPFGITRLVNFFPGKGNWSFTLVQPEDNVSVLTIKVEPVEVWDISLDKVLSGIVPEVFSCNKIELINEDTLYSIDNLADLRTLENTTTDLALAQSTASDVSWCLKLYNFWGASLPPNISDSAVVRDYITKHTWFGSEMFRGSGKRLTWRVLGAPPTILSTNEPVPLLEPPLLNLQLEQEDTFLRVISSPSVKGTFIRHSVFGGLNRVFEVERISDCLRTKGLSNFYAEIYSSRFFSFGTFGKVLVNPEIRSAVRKLISKIDSSSDIEEQVSRLRQKELEEDAEKLTQRIENAKETPRVYWKDKMLSLEPRSELGTLALFSKLEASDGLPFAYFRSMEFASAEGIDTLADFRIASDDVLDTLAPVELEFHYRNFLLHRHPHQHVKMVICWDLGGSHDALGLQPDGRPWLYKTASGLAVVVIRSLPDIEVRQERYEGGYHGLRTS